MDTPEPFLLHAPSCNSLGWVGPRGVLSPVCIFGPSGGMGPCTGISGCCFDSVHFVINFLLDFL